MQLEHSFTVPVGVAQAWEVLLDIERVAPCMPGAVLDSVDGDAFTGRVKIKLGPVNMTYKGAASFVEKDASAHRAVIDARGKDARGGGTASAKVTATLTEESADATRVDVVTDLNITGKPAQFGRGVMVDVGNKLIGQFATCLEGKLAGGGDEPAAATAAPATPAAEPEVKAEPDVKSEPEAAAEPAVTTGTEGDAAFGGGGSDAPDPRPAQPTARPAQPAAEPEPIDLLELAGGTVLAKAVPAVAGAVLLAILIFLLGRRSAR